MKQALLDDLRDSQREWYNLLDNLKRAITLPTEQPDVKKTISFTALWRNFTPSHPTTPTIVSEYQELSVTTDLTKTKSQFRWLRRNTSIRLSRRQLQLSGAVDLRSLDNEDTIEYKILKPYRCPYRRSLQRRAANIELCHMGRAGRRWLAGWCLHEWIRCMI